jgi:hypothetical protein
MVGFRPTMATKGMLTNSTTTIPATSGNRSKDAGVQMNKEILLEHLTYDKDTGKFTWIKPTTNSIKEVGDIAGTYHGDGYIKICIHGNLYRPSLSVVDRKWFIPYGDIDHINCKKDDNRISNLRVVSKSENQMNHGITVRNKSGVKRCSLERVSKNGLHHCG